MYYAEKKKDNMQEDPEVFCSNPKLAFKWVRNNKK